MVLGEAVRVRLDDAFAGSFEWLAAAGKRGNQVRMIRLLDQGLFADLAGRPPGAPRRRACIATFIR